MATMRSATAGVVRASPRASVSDWSLSARATAALSSPTSSLFSAAAASLRRSSPWRATPRSRLSGTLEASVPAPGARRKRATAGLSRLGGESWLGRPSEGPDAVHHPDGVEAVVPVRVPDLAVGRVEGRGAHGVVAAGAPRGARVDGGVEIGDLAGVVGIADVEDAQPRQDERAGDDAGVVALGDGAVVAGVSLQRVVGAGVAQDRSPIGWLVDLEADVGDHVGVGWVGDVDDPGRPDLSVGVRRRASPVAAVGGELVDLDQVPVAADGHRKGHLGNADRGPGDVADLADLGSG